MKQTISTSIETVLAETLKTDGTAPMKNPADIIQAITDEAAAADELAEAKRAEALALQLAENQRRLPLASMIQSREASLEIIRRNTQSLADHTADANVFETMFDAFFTGESGSGRRAYHFFTGDWPFSHAPYVCELISARLKKANTALAELELKIIAEAAEKDLSSMLPPDLRSRLSQFSRRGRREFRCWQVFSIKICLPAPTFKNEITSRAHHLVLRTRGS